MHSVFGTLTVVTLNHRKCSKKWRPRLKLLSRDNASAGFSICSIPLSPPPLTLPPPEHSAPLPEPDGSMFCLYCWSTWHPGRLYIVTPLWVAQETGMTAARHAQRETPEVVTMETSLVVPPFCKCALLLETVTTSQCHLHLHITWAGYHVSESWWFKLNATSILKFSKLFSL